MTSKTCPFRTCCVDSSSIIMKMSSESMKSPLQICLNFSETCCVTELMVTLQKCGVIAKLINISHLCHISNKQKLKVMESNCKLMDAWVFLFCVYLCCRCKASSRHLFREGELSRRPIWQLWKRLQRLIR